MGTDSSYFRHVFSITDATVLKIGACVRTSMQGHDLDNIKVQCLLIGYAIIIFLKFYDYISYVIVRYRVFRQCTSSLLRGK